MKKIVVLAISILLVFSMAPDTFALGSEGLNEDNLEQYSFEPQNISKNQLEFIKDKLLNYDVDEETADKLILKLKNGELWDSMNPKYRDLKPQIKKEHFEKTTYPDGSICVVTTSVPESYETMGSGTSHTDGSGIKYTEGYRVSKDLTVIGMEFTVDFEQDMPNRRARVTSIYDRNVWIIGGTYSNLDYGHHDGWRDKAGAWMSADFTAYQNVAASLGWIKIYVTGDNVWTDYQL